MIINFFCNNCKKSFSVISTALTYSRKPNCHYCKSTDTKRIYNKNIGDIKK